MIKQILASGGISIGIGLVFCSAQTAVGQQSTVSKAGWTQR